MDALSVEKFEPVNILVISVVIPNRNHGVFLERCLHSVLEGPEPADIIWVIDDASEDNSLEIVVKLQLRHPQIRLLKKDRPRGLLRNINELLPEIPSGHVLFLAADDYLLPGALPRIRQILQEYPQVGVVVWDLTIESKLRIRPPHNYRPSRGGGYFPPGKVPGRFGYLPFVGQALFHVSALQKMGGLPEALRWHADHHLAWVLGLRRGIFYEPQCLGVFQEMEKSYSSGMFGEEQSQVLRATVEEWEKPEYSDIRKYLIRGGALAVFGRNSLAALTRVPSGRAYLTPAMRRWCIGQGIRAWWRHPLPSAWSHGLKKLNPKGAMSLKSYVRRPLLREYRRILKNMSWGSIPLEVAEETPEFLRQRDPKEGKVLWWGEANLPAIHASGYVGKPHPNLSEGQPARSFGVWLAELSEAEVHGPSVAVTTRGRAMLADVSIEWNKIPEDHGIMRRFFLPEAETLEGTSLLLASTGGGTYHHWMMDVLTRFPFLEQSGREPRTIDHFLVNGVDLPFQKEALVQLGIPLNKCVVLAKRRRIRCARLLVPSLAFPTSRPSREACGFLGKLFPKQVSERARGRLLVGRAGGVSRQVQRWEEIRNKLLPLGFVEFDPGQASLAEQASVFRGAGIVVGAHGAALTNLVFCQPGTRVLEMFGADYVNPCYRNLCAAAGLEHHAVVDVVGAGQPAQLELIDATREIRGEPSLVAELTGKLLGAG